MISIHVPAWGTTIRDSPLRLSDQFQSTFPRGERRSTHKNHKLRWFNFNPRSRVGNDVGWNLDTTPSIISIHVPAWGTTHRRVLLSKRPKFQSTFPRGERQLLSRRLKISVKISIHVPAWGTTELIIMLDKPTLISIHVPAWGTTRLLSVYNRSALFQSTFPRGERLVYCCQIIVYGQFQSTFPRGERQQISTIFYLYICISSTNSHFSITSFCIFYLIHFFLICFFQLFMVRVFRQFSVYFWFALYRNNT